MAKAVASAFKWVAKVGSIVGVTLLKTATKALTPKVPEVDSASQVNFRANPQAGVPRVIGRTATAGTYIYATVGEAKNRNVLFYSILSSGGPIDSFQSFTMAGEAVVFDGADTPTSGTYRSLVWQRRQLGTTPQAYLQPPNTTDSAVLSEWDSTHATSGYAAAWYVLGADAKAYPNGVPDPLWVLKGVKCYDWRLDSTYPGGSGSHRINDRSTWTWNENPAVHAVAWCLGDIQNGKRVMGLGATISQLAMSKFTEWANVCDANGWKVGGVVYSTDTKWQVLKAICQAGGAYPTALGAKISVIFNAPRVSIATLTGADFETEPSIVGTQLRRDRFNAAVPRYRSEAHKWQIVPAATLVVDSFVTADGGRRTKELEWPLVQNVDQATQLAAYGICNSRELGPLDFGVVPKWMGLEPGDCITINEPEYGLTSQKVIVTGRSRSLGTFERSISCVTETDSKHAYCLGLSGTAPPTPSLAAVDPFPDAPDGANWSAVGGVQTGPTGTAPVITISGVLDDPVASSVIVDYRTSLGGGSYGDWASREWPSSSLATSGGSPAVKLELTGLAPSQPYQIRVRYRSGRGFDDPNTYLSLGTITPGGIAAGTASVAASIIGQAAWATYSSLAPDQVVKPGANLIFDAGLRLRGQGWSLGNWGWGYGVDVGHYMGIGSPTAGTQEAITASFAVFGGQPHTLSVHGNWNGLVSGAVRADVQWFNSSGGSLGYSNPITMRSVAAGNGYERHAITVTAPGAAVTGKVRIFLESVVWAASGDRFAIFYKPKLEFGSAMTVWTDEATNGALYANGVNIDALKPGEIGANVTETRTAAAIIAQGDLATANRASLPFGSNMAINSTFARGSYGWSGAGGASDGQTVTAGVNLNVGYYGIRNVWSASVPSALATGQWFDALYTKSAWNGGTIGDTKIFALPVELGDRVFASARIAIHRLARGEIYILGLNSSGALVEAVAETGGRDGGAANGDPANFDVVSAKLTITNSTCKYVVLMVRGQGDGRSNPYVFVTEPMLGKLAPGQTAIPVYTPGPADPLGDQTSSNTAAAFVGQGSLATLNQAAWATQVTGTGKPEDYATKSLVYRQTTAPSSPSVNDIWVRLNSGGGYPEAVLAWNGSAWIGAADVTGLNTAAAIAGQGSLATLNQATWATQITGTGKPEDYATKSVVYRQATPPASGLTVNDIWVQLDGSGNATRMFAWNGSAWQLGADITGINTAAAISGQGTLATLNEVTWASQVTGTGKPDDYANRSIVYRQTSAPSSPSVNDIWFKLDGSGNLLAVYAWNGSGWVLGADVTSLNTAAGVTGQGPLATVTPPSYAGNAAALAAGLLPGALFTDTTDSNKVKGVISDVPPAIPLAQSQVVADFVPESGTGQTTIDTVSFSANLPAGGKLRISSAITQATGAGDQFSLFTIRIKIDFGGTVTQLGSAQCSIADDGTFSNSTLSALSSVLVDNPGSGAASLIITRQRGGPTASGGAEYDLSTLVEWVNA